MTRATRAVILIQSLLALWVGPSLLSAYPVYGHVTAIVGVIGFVVSTIAEKPSSSVRSPRERET